MIYQKTYIQGRLKNQTNKAENQTKLGGNKTEDADRGKSKKKKRERNKTKGKAQKTYARKLKNSKTCKHSSEEQIHRR